MEQIETYMLESIQRKLERIVREMRALKKATIEHFEKDEGR